MFTVKIVRDRNLPLSWRERGINWPREAGDIDRGSSVGRWRIVTRDPEERGRGESLSTRCSRETISRVNVRVVSLVRGKGGGAGRIAASPFTSTFPNVKYLNLQLTRPPTWLSRNCHWDEHISGDNYVKVFRVGLKFLSRLPNPNQDKTQRTPLRSSELATLGEWTRHF